MKLAAVALDYDGTIAVNGVMDPQVRRAIAELRLNNIAVVLATGRRLDDLKIAAGNLECFNAVVAENGAVLHFPESQRTTVLGQSPPQKFIEGLQKLAIEFAVGDAIVETDAAHAVSVLRLIHSLQLPLMLAFNRGRMMVLPPGIAKSGGLVRALSTLRLSIHNTLGIGDAENDHDLLDACEVGVAVAWGSPTLKSTADEIIPGNGPSAVAPYLLRLAGQLRMSSSQMGRRRLQLGHQLDGRPVQIAIRGRTVIIAGEPGSGKSWLAGLHCEQLILQGYCLCIIDPEGDYHSLEALPGVVLLGGDDPPPRARELAQALHYPDVSVIIDLSKLSHAEKDEYLRDLLPTLTAMRRQSGLPHKILLDEAHYYLAPPEGRRLIDAELAGYILVTYRVSGIDPEVRNAPDTIVMVTRETDEHEEAVLRAICEGAGAEVPERLFRDLGLNEAALLPGAEESHGQVQRFRIGPRLTSHVRHRAKYLDMPVSEPQAFVFARNGRPEPRARTLKEFVELLGQLSDSDLAPYLQRHDFSRWLGQVFRDCPLATHVRTLESRLGIDRPRDLIDDIAQAVRARYELTPSLPL
jgi:hydroxymethylpyrimidine pyrophosphatase-like HAD family hydrolase